MKKEKKGKNKNERPDRTPLNRLKYYREQHNYTQEQCANKFGVTVRTYGGWERGDGNMSYDNIASALRIYKVTFENMFFLQGSPRKRPVVDDSDLTDEEIYILNLVADQFRKLHGKNKITICVFDDDSEYLNMMHLLLHSISEKMNIEIHADYYTNGEVCTIKDYDLYFIDVQMPLINGFELSERVYREAIGKIVFVSSIEEYVFSSYQNHAYDFLRKSLIQEETERVIRRYLKETRDNITLELMNRRFQISSSEIEYIKCNHNNLIIHTKNGDINLRMSMKEFLSLTGILKRFDFVRINQGEIVNLKEIESCHKQIIILKSGIHLSVSRNLFTSFQNMYYTFKYR